jgi:two-component system, OmpR family, phosphate regulon sensor histidine kinase PhoR
VTIALGATLGCAVVLLGLLIAGRLTHERRLREIEEVAADIRGGNTNRRLRSGPSRGRVRSVERELNALAQEIQRTLIEKQRMEAARRLMISHVSHDLRTPLTSMVGYIDALMSDQTLTPDEREAFMRVVKAKCALLGDLIDDLFELSRIETQGAVLEALEPERLDLRALAQNALVSFYGDFQRLGIEPEIHIPDAPVYVAGTGRLLERILLNLVSNVVRHGKGATHIVFSIQEDSDTVVCSLADNGSGIAAAELPFLFDDPYAGSGPRRETQSARGLGLAIVKRLAEAMGGAVTVRSEPWKETIFRLTLRKWRQA